MKFPTYEEMAQNVAEKALDEYEYKGKTLRQWVEIISAIPVTAIPATDNNVATKDGTNLAEVGTDCISREQAIDAFNTNIDELVVSEKENAEAVERYLNRVIDEIKQLPPIHPEIVRCKDCDWWTKQENSSQGRCALLSIYPTGGWFCGNAERRTE